MLFYSPIPNEPGIEGVFRGGFGTLSVFFQMKLYAKTGPKDIKTWLERAHARAAGLGYTPGTYVVQLFATCAIEGNVENRAQDWPANSMVFANSALENLFKPFGSGLITNIVKNLER